VASIVYGMTRMMHYASIHHSSMETQDPQWLKLEGISNVVKGKQE